MSLRDFQWFMLATLFNDFFITKIDKIRAVFPILEQNLPAHSYIELNIFVRDNSVSNLF